MKIMITSLIILISVSTTSAMSPLTKVPLKPKLTATMAFKLATNHIKKPGYHCISMKLIEAY